jgi:serine/threonine-protein kinase
MSPEQACDYPVDRRADVYASGVILWELLTGRRLFTGDDPVGVLYRVVHHPPASPRRFAPQVSSELEAVVLSALSKSPADRPSTARELADAIARVAPVAAQRTVARWVESVAGEAIALRASAVEQAATMTVPPSDPNMKQAEVAVTEVDSLPTETSALPVSIPGVHPPRRWTATAAGLALGVLVLGSVAGWRWSSHRAAPAQAQTRAPVDGTSRGATSAAPAPDPPAPATTPSPMAALPSQSSAPSSPSSRGPLPTRRPSAIAARPSASAAPTAAQCDPPWTLNSEGFRVLKPGCH